MTTAQLRKLRSDFARSGGRARMAKLSARQRSELGRAAVQARWAKHRQTLSKANPSQNKRK